MILYDFSRDLKACTVMWVVSILKVGGKPSTFLTGLSYSLPSSIISLYVLQFIP